MRRQFFTGIIVVGLLLMTSCTEKPEGLQEGCLQWGLFYVALSTGKTYTLLPPEIRREHYVLTSTVDVTTSTLYYVDYTLGMIMSYTVNDAHPKRLYDLPTEEMVEGVRWLLLDPPGTTLYFIIEQTRDDACGTTSTLMAYDLHTDQRRAIPSPEAFALSQRPVWLDDSTLLVLTKHGMLGTLDIESGNLMPIVEHAGYFALSPGKKVLLVNAVSPETHFPPSPEFVLYAFPSLSPLKEMSLDMLRGDIDFEFSFTDEHHVLFSVESDPMLGSDTFWVDLQSFASAKLAKSGFGRYLPVCPSWGFDEPSRAEKKLVWKVKERLERSAFRLPMIDFVSVSSGGHKMITLFGTLRSEEDRTTILELVRDVRGVEHVVSRIRLGDHQWMYEQKIEPYLKWGYKNYTYEQKVYQHLNEYLFYREHLPPARVKQVEELRDLFE